MSQDLISPHFLTNYLHDKREISDKRRQAVIYLRRPYLSIPYPELEIHYAYGRQQTSTAKRLKQLLPFEELLKHDRPDSCAFLPLYSVERKHTASLGSRLPVMKFIRP
jgi:hypothetical protein